MPRIYTKTPPEERFWRHVNKDGPLPPLYPELGNCWLWTGSLDPQGYGHFWAGDRTPLGNPQPIYAHRFAFGNCPDGLEVSHRCEVEHCVRRSHLLATTHKQNVRYGNGKIATRAAQTHCKRGHEFTEANTVRYGKYQTRTCRACFNSTR